jgi:hypothetical protein
VGIFPLGSLLMMVMRRRSGAEPQAEKVPEEPSAATPRQPALQELIERLEALERRLPSSAAATATATPLDEGAVLDPTALETLAAEPSVSAREAATALGYRSTASLSNLGSRAGYPIGLVKLGVNGKVAVYRGVSPSSSGGKAQRHWVVVRLNRLER